MNISYLKIGWGLVTGRAGDVADYLLDIENDALAKLDPNKKDSIAAVLNTSLKVMGVLDAIAWLVPTKWQLAYRRTVDVLECACVVLEDFTITESEAKVLKRKVAVAVKAWKDPDDPTCVTLDDVMVED